MPKYRRTRINDEMTRVISESLRTVKDPRVSGALITVTRSEVSGDLKYAKIYFSAFGADAEEVKEIKKGLYSAAGYMRSYVASELNLRITPELNFEFDSGIEHGEKIMRLIKSIETENEKEVSADE